MATTPDQTILLSYYIKRKYYHHAITLCDKLIQQKGQSDTIGFWKAVASSFEGNYDEAISEFDNLRGSAEFELAVIDALLYTHKQKPRVDDTAVEELEDSRRGVEKKCTMTAKQRAAEYNILIGEYRAANKLCTKILGENPDHTEAKIIQFNVECLIAEEKNKEREKTGGKERRSKDDDGEGKEEKGKDKKLLGILQEMQSLMSRNSASRVLIDGNMAISRYYLSKKKFNESLEALNKILVACPWYFPASLEKVRVFSTQTKWDQCEEILSSILVNDANQIEAVMYKLFVDSIIDSSIDIVGGLKDLLLLYNKLEPKNAELYYKTSQLFCRLSGKDTEMIRITLEMCKKSCDLQPIGHPEYLVELGYEYSMINDYKSAVAAYTKANEQDDSNSDGLTGILYCQIQQGLTSEATQQLEFLKVIQDEGDESAQFLYLNALLDFSNDRNLIKFMVRLQKAYETHKSQIRRKIYLLINTPEWFIVYNPLFPLNIVEAIINQIPFEPIDETQTETPELKTAKSIVSDLLGYCPNTITILYYSARLQYLYRDFNSSLSIIAKILQKDPGNSLAYLLRAKIALSKEDYREAQSALDEAVSHNFDVRNYPIYFIIKGEVLDNKGDYNEALKLLKTSMTLPGMKKGNNSMIQDKSKKVILPTSNEKAQLYMLLARVYSDLNQVKEGKATIQEALSEFKGTPNEVNIMVASAELSLKRGDAKTAFKLLNHIQEDNKYFVKIQIVKADIYLKYVNNKRKYIDCYRKIVEKFNTPEMNMMVGDALMKIQRPDEAIAEYENALSHKNNPALAYKIGKAYMSIHQYQQAIDKFSKALKNDSSNIEYRYSLADLYFKLDKYDMSIGLITQGLNETENKTDITSIMHTIKLLRLYADISKTQGDSDKYLNLLEKTHDKQVSLLDSLKGEQPEKVQEQRIIAADLCYDIALHYISTGSSTNAVKYLTNALKHDAGHINSMLQLTKIYIKQEDIDRAEEQCGKLLTVAPQNEEAAMILADILFEKNDFAKAIGYFETSLSKKADNFVALYRLIKLMYRNGQIKDVEQYLKAAERTSEVSRNCPGYFFCKGLFLRYTNEPHDAIEYLNKARKNEYWGPLATELMVQIFLNPENEKLWATDTCEPDAIKSLQAAEYLLSDPCFDKDPEKKSIYHAYTLMYTKEKSKILEGLEEVNRIMTTNKECIPAYLAISIGYMLDKQTTKARNFLKTMARFPYNQLEAQVFEDSWLLLSDIYIQSGKYDLAQENCKKALFHNKSCARAWEQMGYIMEKECSYKDAADNYEKAWELLYHSDASIGYKLGFNYLKAKRFVEAIDVCSDVLKKFPDYPKIREDILRKAQENLRS